MSLLGVPDGERPPRGGESAAAELWISRPARATYSRNAKLPQGRGFAHGHEKFHSEPKTKAIDLIELFLGSHGSGVAEHEHHREEALVTWMDAHRAACLEDAATKQYDSAGESARHFGCAELQEVFTAEEKTLQIRRRRRGGWDAAPP